MIQKGDKMDQKGLKYMKKGFLDQKYLFSAQFFFSGSLRTPLPPKQEIDLPKKISGRGVAICIWKIRTVLKSSKNLVVISKNLEIFEIIRKIGSHLEKSGQFSNNLGNW